MLNRIPKKYRPYIIGALFVTGNVACMMMVWPSYHGVNL